MSTVLIVDDEPKMRELMERYLQPAGYVLQQASDAAAALDQVRAGGIDVVVSDISMPGHDGVWLVTHLRAEFPHVAIVLVTGVDTLPASVTLQEGVVAYLLKPYSGKAVLRAVEQAVAWQRQAAVRGGPDLVDAWLAANGRRRTVTG